MIWPTTPLTWSKTPMPARIIHSTATMTTPAMPRATDSRNDIFIADHGSTRETVSRTRRRGRPERAADASCGRGAAGCSAGRGVSGRAVGSGRGAATPSASRPAWLPAQLVATSAVPWQRPGPTVAIGAPGPQAAVDCVGRSDGRAVSAPPVAVVSIRRVRLVDLRGIRRRPVRGLMRTPSDPAVVQRRRARPRCGVAAIGERPSSSASARPPPRPPLGVAGHARRSRRRVPGLANCTPCVLRPVRRTSSTRERTMLPFSMTTMTSSSSSTVRAPTRSPPLLGELGDRRRRGCARPLTVQSDAGVRLARPVSKTTNTSGSVPSCDDRHRRAASRRRGTSCR